MPRPIEASFVAAGLPRSGDRVGASLRVVGPIGSGSLSATFLCDDEALGRRVAMKMLRPDLPDLVSRAHAFLCVARETARVISANVVTIFDLGLHEGLPYYVMEHIPGVNLEEHLADHGGRFSVEVASKLVASMLRGLEAMHQQRLAHGAMSASNVLITPDGRVVLTDIGMGKVEAASLRPRPSSMVDFHPTHLGPVDEPRFEDEARTDVHATAVLLFRMLTGEAPTIDPRTRRVRAPSTFTTIPRRLDETLVDVLSSRDSILLDAHALRAAIERIAKRRGSSTSGARRILVVDANEERANATEAGLSASLDADIRCTGDKSAALELASRVDLVILDPDDFGSDALELASSLLEVGEGVPVLVLTERLGSSDLGLLRGLGVQSCLFRPIDPPMLASVAEEMAFEYSRNREQIAPIKAR